MDRPAAPHQPAKVDPTESEENYHRDSRLPVGSTLSFNQRTAKPHPQQQKHENINVVEQPRVLIFKEWEMRGAEVTGSGTEGRPVTKQPGTEQTGAVYSSSHRPQAETPSKHHTQEQDKYNPGTLQLSNPYEQPFTIKAALSLQIPDKELQFHLIGYNIFQETRASK